MTAQMNEILHMDGERYALCSLPLEGFFELGGDKPAFFSPNTACWRGYIGQWELRADRLYLVELRGWLENGARVAGLVDLFPGFPDRVFAHWCSDTLRIPQGRRLKYVHAGFGSEFECDLLLTFRHGVLTHRTVRVNGKAEPGAPEGYSVAAFTSFPKSGR